jgi:ABC-type sugar transport system ATPase subunit
VSQVRAATDDDNDRVDPARPLLELTEATVRFGEETALDAVDFRMFPGEVHSLMGENGAGKSTLVKAITGALTMESGILRLEGQQVTFTTPRDAQVAGISTVSAPGSISMDTGPLFEASSNASSTWSG